MGWISEATSESPGESEHNQLLEFRGRVGRADAARVKGCRGGGP